MKDLLCVPWNIYYAEEATFYLLQKGNKMKGYSDGSEYGLHYLPGCTSLFVAELEDRALFFQQISEPPERGEMKKLKSRPRRGTTRVSHLSDENPTKNLFGILIKIFVGIPDKIPVGFPPAFW